VTQPPILALPNLNKLAAVEYVEIVGIRALSMQKRHLITYINKFLGLKKHALSIYKREMMTLLYAIIK